MKIRLGYACITNSLPISSSSVYTYSEYLKKKDICKLDEVIKYNLSSLKEILIYNIKNNIHFYRMSSKLIPLATKDDVVFDYIDNYSSYYNEIAKIVNNNDIRIDFHPDQFCVLNSVKADVVDSSIKILEYHYKLLEAFGIKDKILILHVGSSVPNKKEAIERFIKNFNSLPKYLKDSIAIENDDKIFNADDVVRIAKETSSLVCLDYHHHMCNKSDIDFDSIFSLWKKRNMTVKMHFSSPKNKKEFRSHNDYIDVFEFIKFINLIKKYDTDVDVMIEAKTKDDALFRLVRELKYYTDYKFIDDTSFEV